MAAVYDIESAKAIVEEFYKSEKPMLINVSIRRPRIELERVSVSVKGVYPHIFRVETAEKENYCLQYTDILTGKIEILD